MPGGLRAVNITWEQVPAPIDSSSSDEASSNQAASTGSAGDTGAAKQPGWVLHGDLAWDPCNDVQGLPLHSCYHVWMQQLGADNIHPAAASSTSAHQQPAEALDPGPAGTSNTLEVICNSSAPRVVSGPIATSTTWLGSAYAHQFHLESVAVPQGVHAVRFMVQPVGAANGMPVPWDWEVLVSSAGVNGAGLHVSVPVHGFNK